jgi:hypothetical protein
LQISSVPLPDLESTDPDFIGDRPLNLVRVDVRDAGIAMLIEYAPIDGGDPNLDGSAAAP